MQLGDRVHLLQEKSYEKHNNISLKVCIVANGFVCALCTGIMRVYTIIIAKTAQNNPCQYNPSPKSNAYACCCECVCVCVCGRA